MELHYARPEKASQDSCILLHQWFRSFGGTCGIPANLEVGLPAEDYFPVGDEEALSEKLKAVMSRPFGHVEYDMGKYDREGIADEVGAVYDGNIGRFPAYRAVVIPWIRHN